MCRAEGPARALAARSSAAVAGAQMQALAALSSVVAAEAQMQVLEARSSVVAAAAQARVLEARSSVVAAAAQVPALEARAGPLWFAAEPQPLVPACRRSNARGQRVALRRRAVRGRPKRAARQPMRLPAVRSPVASMGRPARARRPHARCSPH